MSMSPESRPRVECLLSTGRPVMPAQERMRIVVRRALPAARERHVGRYRMPPCLSEMPCFAQPSSDCS